VLRVRERRDLEGRIFEQSISTKQQVSLSRVLKVSGDFLLRITRNSRSLDLEPLLKIALRGLKFPRLHVFLLPLDSPRCASSKFDGSGMEFGLDTWVGRVQMVL
jgi:hypothetical protein